MLFDEACAWRRRRWLRGSQPLEHKGTPARQSKL